MAVTINQQVLRLQKRNEELKAENERLRNSAHEAVDYVAFANYDSRVSEAHRMIASALEEE